MPLLKATPILAYLDGDATVSFYEKLGFESNTSYEGYLMFSKDLISIHLWRCDDESIPKNTGCYVYVDEIETLYKECEALGIDVDEVFPNNARTQSQFAERSRPNTENPSPQPEDSTPAQS